MAQVVMNHFGKGRMEAFSAGSKPAGYIHPLAIKALQEARFPTDGLRSKSWEEYAGQPFDFVITVCDRAKESCPVWLRDPASIEAGCIGSEKQRQAPGRLVTAHWGLEDPAEAQGTDEEKERVFRKVFGEIQLRIQFFLALPMDKLSFYELEKRVREIGLSLREQPE